MNEFTLADLGVFLGVCGGIITTIILTLQKSKCKKVKCCGMSCERQVPPTAPPSPVVPNEGGQGD